MTPQNKKEFLTYFPDHVYRYIDQTGENRPPVSSTSRKDELNKKGYESYFTVNGFKDAPNAQKDNCSSLNAFFVDIDGRKEWSEIEEIKKKLDPTFVIETMNGYHIYWLLDEPVYKDEVSEMEWKEAITRWEQIENSIVTELKADIHCKDIPRILRVPQTYYWKKTGDQWKKGVTGVFKIKGKYKEPSNRYSMDQIQEVFPIKQSELTFNDSVGLPDQENYKKAKEMAEAEKKVFFDSVNEMFPIEERDSFKKLISGKEGTLPGPNMRNQALLITASLMRQAGWSKERAIKQIEKVGWHGIESENGGVQEIINTINHAYNGGYVYSYKNEIIEYNMSAEESQKIQMAYTGVLKMRKEQDKVRYSNYEREILAKNPYLRKNDIGIVFRYHKGVYKMMSDQEMSDMVLNGLYEDMLWGYRTKKSVADKVACLLSIIPLLEVSKDAGSIVNVKNGLLNIATRELIPHTPEYVSLIQLPVEYDPEAKCPIWDECIDSWMEGPEKEQKTRLVKQFCGYILSSSMLYDRALFMVGDGGNGKSTFIDTIARVIGPESTSHIDLEGLYSTFGMHGLIGKRLNIIEEVSGNYYQSNKLKKLISGEEVTIDIKYKPQFTFRPQAKFVFSVNELPRVDDTSSASERRICAVKFLNNYRKNPNVKLRSAAGLLAQELPGILNWMLDGIDDLIEEGNFVVTDEQTQMLNEYRAENSSVEGFLSQCIELDPESSIETPKLYSEYKKWCESEGGRKIKANITFTKEVKNYAAKNDDFTYKAREYAGSESAFYGIKLSHHWTDRDKNPNNW